MTIFPTSPSHSVTPSPTHRDSTQVHKQTSSTRGRSHALHHSHPHPPSLPHPLTPSQSLSLTLSLFFLLISILPAQINAQFTNPEINLETYGVVSSSGTTPFWLQSNRHGMFSSEGSQFLTRIQAHSTDNQLTKTLKLSYGADFIARPGTQSTASFNQGYLRLDGYGLFLQAGRFYHVSPDYNWQLGMGSLGVSGNASPVPQVRAGLSDWTSLPFTNDFIQIKGHVAHGWLGSNRVMDDVLYHEKIGHARFGGDFPLNLYGGLEHYVLWGGSNHPQFGDLPSTFSDFGRIFIAIGGDENAPPGDENYVLGDHLGAWDFGFYFELDAFSLRGYRQFPIETKSNLKFKSYQDGLTGIDLQFSEPALFSLTNIVYEFLYTKWQAGPRREDTEDERGGFPFQGNENYYNNGVYQTGWAYQRMTIGNPLFIPREDNLGIKNNRIVAHHLGAQFELSNMQLYMKTTASRNYGNWGNPFSSEVRPSMGEPFIPRRDQFSFLGGISLPITVQEISLSLTIEAAYDIGDLVGSQLGGLVGIKYLLAN